MYTIAQASALSGISRDMIRYYEKLGLISPGRERNNYRSFNDADLYRLVMIRYLSNLGVSLKMLSGAIEHDDLSGMIAQLRKECGRLNALQKYIAAQANAAEASLSSFLQLQSGGTPQRRVLQQRRLCSRASIAPDAYVDLCSRIAQQECFFQYYCRQAYERFQGVWRQTESDVGIMLYDPLPFDAPCSRVLPRQRFYLATMRVDSQRLVTAEEMKPHLEAVVPETGERVTVYSYQIFESARAHRPCAIAVEIPLETEER